MESTGSGSMEKRLGITISCTITTTTRAGPQGSLPGPIVEVGPDYAKPSPLALGNCISIRAAQTLRTAPPDKRCSITLGQFWIYRYILTF